MRLQKIRKIFIIIVSLSILIIVEASIARVTFRNYKRSEELFGKFTTKVIYNASEVGTLLKGFFNAGSWLIESPIDSFENNINSKGLNNLKILISYKEARNNDIIELINLNNLNTIKSWTPPSKLIDELSYNENNPRRYNITSDLNFLAPLMLSDSSVVFNTNSSLVMVNKNSEIVFVNNDYEFHHSIEIDNNENIVAVASAFKSKIPEYLKSIEYDITKEFKEDLIIILDKKGKVLYEKSLVDLFEENNLNDYLYSKYFGLVDSDPFHLNDIQPVVKNSKFFKEGDLFLSVRNPGLIVLFRPSEDKVIWFKQGPWFQQHDVDIFDEYITVFGNDVRYFSSINTDIAFFPNQNNRIYKYDFSNDSVNTIFDNHFENLNINTITQGLHEISNDIIMVEETNYGKLYFFDKQNRLLTFTKRRDSNYIYHLNWTRLLKD